MVPGLAVVKDMSRVERPYLLSGSLERVWINHGAPLQVKSFREAEFAVMDNLDRMLANKIIDNLHLMILINLTSKLDLFSQ